MHHRPSCQPRCVTSGRFRHLRERLFQWGLTRCEVESGPAPGSAEMAPRSSKSPRPDEDRPVLPMDGLPARVERGYLDLVNDVN
jgi:hypothetical protein